MQNRTFLFLQGPHGPFFRQLAKKISDTGADVCRIGFTSGDAFFWCKSLRYSPYNDSIDNWEPYLAKHLVENNITDIVLYGDSRPIHKVARQLGEKLSIVVHCFEEGYLRPYWATYERGGTNGHSRLLDLKVKDMAKAIEKHPMELPEAPAQWGTVWHHAFYGFLYHLVLSLPSRTYRNYTPHRSISVQEELLLYIRKILLMPLNAIKRRLMSRNLLRSGTIYHLVLLQLSHDASLQTHSDFSSNKEFIELIIEKFSKYAPSHHHLVFKAHPFEDEREPHPKNLQTISSKYDVADRVRYIPGGKLGPLLDGANTAITVNSTAAQQALWRGLPIRAFGRSVFSKPEFLIEQNLDTFFENPQASDKEAYISYRQFLLETSQIAGGYYTQRGRSELMRRVVDLMLSEQDPYDMILNDSNEHDALSS